MAKGLRLAVWFRGLPRHDARPPRLSLRWLLAKPLASVRLLRPRSSILAWSALLLAAGGCASESVTTHHNDNLRTGAYTVEHTLNAANVNVNQFGRIATFHVDGDVYAQPLYVRSASISGIAARDVLIVATAHNTVYAFDANASGDVTKPLWSRSFGGAVPMPNPDFGNLDWTCGLYLDNHGHALPTEADRVRTTNHVWYNMREIGVTGTPVIDEASSAIYVVSFQRDNQTHAGTCMDFGACKPPGTHNASCACPLQDNCDVHGYHYFLHALDLASGAELHNGPVEITGSAPATSAGSVGGRYSFDPKLQLQRAALLLAPHPSGAGGAGRKIVYIAFAGHGDVGLYHGWLFAYDAQSLTQAALFLTMPERDPRPFYGIAGDGRTTPFDRGEQGGIWQSGSGPSSDAEGNVYLMTGNGSNTVASGGKNVGDSFVRLTLSGNSFLVTSWSPTPDTIDTTDSDLGASGPVILSNMGLIVGGGKPGTLFLLDTALTLKWRFQATWESASPDCVDRVTNSSHIHGSPVYWDGPMGPTLYVWGEQDYLKAYRLTSNGVDLDACPGDPRYGHPVGQSADKAVLGGSMPGGAMSLSSSGKSPGTGILWASRPFEGTALQNVPPGILEAFEATDPGIRSLPPDFVLRRLWSSEDNAKRDRLGNYARFTPPTVAHGRVFMASFSNVVAVYGPLTANVCNGGEVNPCGGCNTLLTHPGQWCQDRATGKCGQWRCLGNEATICDTSGTSTPNNECGGCALFPFPLSGHGRGDSCLYNDFYQGILVCAKGGNDLICCPFGTAAPGCGPGSP